MQERFCSSLQFLQRTDALASALGCRLLDLPEKIGISERAMFGYRKGSYPVTERALRKLQEAEQIAGINADSLEANLSVIREDPPLYRVKTRPPAAVVREMTIPERLSKIERNIEESKDTLMSMKTSLDVLTDLFVNRIPKEEP